MIEFLNQFIVCFAEVLRAFHVVSLCWIARLFLVEFEGVLRLRLIILVFTVFIAVGLVFDPDSHRHLAELLTHLLGWT